MHCKPPNLHLVIMKQNMKGYIFILGKVMKSTRHHIEFFSNVYFSFESNFSMSQMIFKERSKAVNCDGVKELICCKQQKTLVWVP